MGVAIKEPIMPAYTTPTVTPYLLYEDLRAAWEWLEKAFGFRLRHPIPTGKISHVEMAVGDDGVILMGCPASEYQNPKRLGTHRTQYLYVRVTDLDEHFARAIAAGGIVIEAPADQPYGDRRCAVEDPEGHQWYFAQSIGGAAAS
jgi:PhnB protein